jgi:integrase
LSERRHRIPTENELQSLRQHFSSRDGRADIPMSDVMQFAIYTHQRAADICRLNWQSVDPATRSGLLPDSRRSDSDSESVKRVRFSSGAWEILQRQPRTQKTIFPYKAKSICVAFSRACEVLGIDNLSFDDLRREPHQRLPLGNPGITVKAEASQKP